MSVKTRSLNQSNSGQYKGHDKDFLDEIEGFFRSFLKFNSSKKSQNDPSSEDEKKRYANEVIDRIKRENKKIINDEKAAHDAHLETILQEESERHKRNVVHRQATQAMDVIYAKKDLYDTIKDFIDDFTGVIQNIFGLIKKLVPVLSTVSSVFSGVFKGISYFSAIGSVFSGVSEVIFGLVDLSKAKDHQARATATIKTGVGAIVLGLGIAALIASGLGYPLFLAAVSVIFVKLTWHLGCAIKNHVETLKKDNGKIENLKNKYNACQSEKDALDIATQLVNIENEHRKNRNAIVGNIHGLILMGVYITGIALSMVFPPAGLAILIGAGVYSLLNKTLFKKFGHPIGWLAKKIMGKEKFEDKFGSNPDGTINAPKNIVEANKILKAKGLNTNKWLKTNDENMKNLKEKNVQLNAEISEKTLIDNYDPKRQDTQRKAFLTDRAKSTTEKIEKSFGEINVQKTKETLETFVVQQKNSRPAGFTLKNNRSGLFSSARLLSPNPTVIDDYDESHRNHRNHRNSI